MLCCRSASPHQHSPKMSKRSRGHSVSHSVSTSGRRASSYHADDAHPISWEGAPSAIKFDKHKKSCCRRLFFCLYPAGSSRRKSARKASLARRQSMADTSNISVLQELSYETYADYENEDEGVSIIRSPTLDSYFRFGEIWGVGETAVVFEAIFLPTNENVAVKFIHDFSPLRTQILRELKVLKISDRCRYLVKHHSHFRIGRRCYIVSELLSQYNFDWILSEHRNMPHNLVRIYMKQLASAIIFLHEKTFIHRDISLKNLVLDNEGNLRLVDYGMSRSIRDPMGQTFSELGTLTYAAPEIFKDKLCSHPVDWWSTGVILYRFVTGGFPFPTSNRRMASYYAITKHKVVYPAEFFSSNRDLYTLNSRLLEMKVEKRIGTANEREIMAHPFFEGIDWGKRDDIHKFLLNLSVEELVKEKGAYNHFITIFDKLSLAKSLMNSKRAKQWSSLKNAFCDNDDDGFRRLVRSDSSSTIHSTNID